VTLKRRLDRLEVPTQSRSCTGAKQELLRRLERTDPETSARVLTAIRERQKRDTQE